MTSPNKVRMEMIKIAALLVMFLSGGHLLDIGNVGKDLYFTNGYFIIDADKIHHLGYYLMYVDFMLLVLLYIFKTTENEKARQDNKV